MTSRCVPLTRDALPQLLAPGTSSHIPRHPGCPSSPPHTHCRPSPHLFPRMLIDESSACGASLRRARASQTEDESASAYHRVGWQGSMELTDAWASTAARTARHNTQGRLQCSPLDRDLCHISHSQLPRRLLQWCLFVFYFTRAFYGRQPYAWAVPRSLKYSHTNSPNDTTPKSPPPYNFSTRTCS